MTLNRGWAILGMGLLSLRLTWAAETAIPLEQVSAQAEATSDELKDLSSQLNSDSTLSTINNELPAFLRELNARLEESSRLLWPTPSLDTIRIQERSLTRMEHTLDEWTHQLTKRAEVLNKEQGTLDHLDQLWTSTLSSARVQKAPTQVLAMVQSSLMGLHQAEKDIDERRTQYLSTQTRIAAADRRVDTALDEIKEARKQLLKHLFRRDSPVLWNAPLSAEQGRSWTQETKNSISNQVNAFQAFADREEGRFLFHGLWIIFLTFLFYRLRMAVKPLTTQDEELARTARIFESPWNLALLLSIITAHWIYPQAPRLWWAFLGAVALIPATLMLQDIVHGSLIPALNVLILFYFMDQLRLVAAALPLVSRSILTAELAAGTMFLAFHYPKWPFKRARFWIVYGAFAVGFLASFLGYVSLAVIAGDVILGSAYAGVLLYALYRILDVLVLFALEKKPLVLFHAVREYRSLIWRRISFMLKAAAWVLWGLVVLGRLTLREPFFEGLKNAFAATWTVGSLSLSLGNLLAFIVTVWAAFKISRFVRFLLETDVYPRFHLAAGLPYAMSMMLHYLILLTGFFMAAAALGFDMTKFTILAGAFGVGLGFGMQTIVNNFVSGLIILFERPIKVGDIIQVEDAQGRVEAIGIRATTVRTVNGSRVIVPNGSLLASRVTNWSGSHREREIDIPVAVGYGAKADEVMALLEHAAEAHPLVSKNPPPEALVTKMGGGALNLELHAWTDRPEERLKIQSDLTLKVTEALAQAKIPVQ